MPTATARTRRATHVLVGLAAAGFVAASSVDAQTSLAYGVPMTGELTPQDSLWSGVHYDVFTISCCAGEPVRFTVRSSDFDAFLWAVAPEMPTGSRTTTARGAAMRASC